MIYEIRSYHFNPALLGEYKEWVQKGPLSYLKKNLDIVGFWVGKDIDSEVLGSSLDELGSANVVWIIRWKDMDKRNSLIPKILESTEWERLFAKVPGGEDSYFRVELKFMEMY